MGPRLKTFRIERQAAVAAGILPEASTALAPTVAAAPVPGAPGCDFTAAEMLALRQALAAGSGLSRAADELAAIVNDTARAANAIIGSSEEIDNLVLRLRATAGRDPGSDVADELAEHSLLIFQACGFQDLTGQRIANVVDVLHEFDRKLKALRDLWNGIAEKRPPSSPANDLFVAPAPAGSLENGPRLPADAGHLTQAEIDAIFE
ncbi:MAG: hypothetical protein U1E62_04570 [Alsobacter sp.]